MSTDAVTTFIVGLGKAQIDAMFQRQDQRMLDDSHFIPMLEVVLNALETVGVDKKAVEELWQHAYMAYDSACRDTMPAIPFDENKELMQKYLLGPRKFIPPRKRRRR